MARVVFPIGFVEQHHLLKLVVEKHLDDGAASPIFLYLNEHNIDLAACLDNGTAAVLLHYSRQRIVSDAENFREQRDVLFNPVLKNLRGCAQYLKMLYSSHNRELGNWGLEVNSAARIVYPRRFAERHALFVTFKEKHDSYPPGASPLAPFLAEQGISLAGDLAAANNAAALQDVFSKAAGVAENAKEQRDLLWLPIAAHLRGMAAFLKKLYAAQPKKLGNWGFVVDDSKQKPKLRKSKVLPGAKITTAGVVLNSEFINIGETPLHIYRGKRKQGDFIQVLPNEKAKMLKGFSMITVVNPSSTETGRYTLELIR